MSYPSYTQMGLDSREDNREEGMCKVHVAGDAAGQMKGGSCCREPLKNSKPVTQLIRLALGFLERLFKLCGEN